MNLNDPATAAALTAAGVAVVQLTALAFVLGWYAVRDRYSHDCDHGDHKLIPVGAQTQMDAAASMLTGRRHTLILYRCRYCTHVEDVTVAGEWSLAQIRAWGAGIIPAPDWDPAAEPAGAPS